MSVLQRLEAAAQSERPRWLLWLPVGLAAGALLYFSLRFEPSSYGLLPLLGLPLLLRTALRRGWRVAALLAMISMSLATGFIAAKLATDRTQVTMLPRELRFAQLQGQVVEIGDEAGGKLKLTIALEKIEGLAPEETPQRVRVSYRGAANDPAHALLTGDRIALRVGLLPPSGPVMPGAFDFGRYFYFKSIGGVGYGVPPIERLEAREESSWALYLAQLRQRLSQRIRDQLPPVEGSITAALMMGDRAGIPSDVNQQMRDANLSHILSISGLHMAIFTGLVFLGVRYALLLPRATRHLPQGKQIAAASSLLVGGLYLLISGMPSSAVRAYIMVAFLLGAVLLRREAMPMRSLAFAAVLMLLWWPAHVLDPGFQLSFMATAALIAWYEWITDRAGQSPEPHHWRRRLMLYLGGIMATSLVAEGATAPLVLYHFNSVSLYGMLANLIVSPVVSFLIMPGIIVAYLLMPLGLESIALQAVGAGVWFMVEVAERVAAIPHAQFFARAMPGWACALAMLGLCWVIIWQRRVRWLGLVAMAAGMAGIFITTPPDLYISHDGKQIAGRIDGQLSMLKGRPQSFIPMQWANVNGMDMLPYAPKGDARWRCDALGCVFTFGGKRAAFSNSLASLKEDCAKAEIIAAPYYIRRNECEGASMLIDRRALETGGTHWLWLEGNTPRIGNSAQEVGARPWR